MKIINDKENKAISCINCITGKAEKIVLQENRVVNVSEIENGGDADLFIAPGLIDLQINGINGIDFNVPSLTKEDVANACNYLLSKGVTTFLPTVITNSDENIISILQTIDAVCKSNSLVNECVWGIHLEGPFISPEDGAKGAHDKNFIKAPDWELFMRYQQAAGGKIKIITLAPEWDGSYPFIKKCRDQGIIVSIGHSMAGSDHIKKAIEAGATLSTHLGNGVPLLLQRHPNIIWDQLASEELYACIITDGIHIPDSLIKSIIKIKKEKTLIVSDATCFAGMPPGEYESHIGGSVVLDNEKRVSLKGSPGLLAGAAKSLLENIETLLKHDLATLSDSWQMASTNVTQMLARHGSEISENVDFVIFQLKDEEIQIKKVIKNRTIVFEQ